MARYSLLRCLLGLLAPCSAALGASGTLLNQVQARFSHRGLVDVDSGLKAIYPEHYLSTPIDHLHNETRYEPHSNGSFGLRYWFDAQFYEPGGPVFVLMSGESDGEARLPYLQKGIIYELAKATHGVGVILEHRYYGKSIPVDDFSTANLRFLTTEQALADTAYFAENAVFPGLLEHADLGPRSTPWVAYGGSYAGAFAAFLRVVYPDTYRGAISSSGVPVAIWDYWQYYEAARLYGPPDCVAATQKIVDVVDTILLAPDHGGRVQQLKDAFGLGNVTAADDFANALSSGISGLQGLNWDPAVSDDAFFEYCANVSSQALLYPALAERAPSVRELVSAGGHAKEPEGFVTQVLNAIGYLNLTSVSRCGSTQDECYSQHNATMYARDDITQEWRLWSYQVCTEWGYLQTGSGVPAGAMPLISRLVDVEYSSTVCREAFNLSGPADVAHINRYGGYDISYPYLAFVDGEWDPWREAGVHALSRPGRPSTAREPAILIDRAVHHWDENGLLPGERTADLPPPPVAHAQEAIVEFVRGWLGEWRSQGDDTDNVEL